MKRRHGTVGRRIRGRRPITYVDVLKIADAVIALRQARNLLREARAPNARRYTAEALKSAIGAHNHASRMWRHYGDPSVPHLSRAVRERFNLGTTRARP